jgi:phosphate:Na+ symporter
MSGAEAFLNSLAGLGLLFFGIKLVSRNLGNMTGDRLRFAITKASKRTEIAALIGILTGFVMQSGRTTSLILASFVQAQMITVRRALPITLWANLGCTLIIFAVVFPIHLLVLFIIAVAGACAAFEWPKSLATGAYAVFGLGLMLFGLDMMSSAASVWAGEDSFAIVLTFIRSSLVLAFFAGMVMTVLAQSHMAIMLIAVAMATKGTLDVEHVVAIILGTHAGSGINSYIAGMNFRGEPRHLVIAQSLYNAVGIAVIAALMIIAGMIIEPEVFSRFADRFIPSPGVQTACFAVIFNTVTPVLLMIFAGPYQRLCAALAPQLKEETLAQPEFLSRDGEENAVATLMLAEQEQLRLVKRLPAYCSALREESASLPSPGPETYHNAFVQIDRAIERSQRTIMAHEMTEEDTGWLLNQQKRQEFLAVLDEACFELWQVGREASETGRPLCDAIVESLDTLLLYLIDAFPEGDDDALDLLDVMTRDRGSAMEKLRRNYLSTADEMSFEDRRFVLQITSIFERAAWSVRRIALLVREIKPLV